VEPESPPAAEQDMPATSAPVIAEEPAPAAPVVEVPPQAPIEPVLEEVPQPVPEEPTPDLPDVDAPGIPEVPQSFRKMRILAAEDNKTNQLVFRKMIKALDIDLKFANNGNEAVAAYQEFQPDMVFMDISMPGMDGKEATGEIRKIEAETGAHIPIVALTAHAQDGDEQPILDAGLDHYLTKPLRKPAIHDMIRQLVPDTVSDPFVEVDSAALRQAG